VGGYSKWRTIGFLSFPPDTGKPHSILYAMAHNLLHLARRAHTQQRGAYRGRIHNQGQFERFLDDRRMRGLANPNRQSPFP
jgi:hypothetical protein